jgi:hypothetical protein
MRTIRVKLNESSIDAAIKELKEYKSWVKRKKVELLERLAAIGATQISISFARTPYTGEKDYEIAVEQVDKRKFAIIVDGETAALLEFGAGITYGDGHPYNSEFGMGPGTYPDGKGHWDDPNGWWYGNHEHSYGNPPAQAMYNAKREIQAEVQRIADEVFA